MLEQDDCCLFHEYEQHARECLNVYSSAVDFISYTSVYVFKFHAFYIMLMGLVSMIDSSIVASSLWLKGGDVTDLGIMSKKLFCILIGHALLVVWIWSFPLGTHLANHGTIFNVFIHLLPSLLFV